jgi:Holliday junction resolvase RusA-like endonuclease
LVAAVISFFVDMVPVGKARARVTRHGTYTPKATVEAERLIGWECKKTMAGAKPLEGAVEIEIVTFFPIPESWSKAKKAEAYWHTSKPDGDNIAKLVKDSLNGVAWIDDAQVARQTIIKRYVRDGHQVGLHVWIGELL